MAQSDIKALTEKSKDDLGHIEDHKKITRGLKTLDQINKVKLKTLWTPYSAELYPASDLTTFSIDSSDGVPSIHPNGYYGALWNDPRLNTQCCVWVPVDAANPSAGARNNPTTRNGVGAVVDFEFEYTGQGLTFMAEVADLADFTVYASDEQGSMRRLSARPKVYTGPTTFAFIHVKFASIRPRRIRFVGPAFTFYQVLYDNGAIIRKSPDRDLIVSISDSFREASGMKNASIGGIQSIESYHTGAINDWYCERTGWAIMRMGQGGTGYFNNGSGTASNNAGPVGSRPFFADENVAKIKAIGKNKIRIIDVNGTLNDGSLSGGIQSMKARALEGINKIYTWDPGIRFIIWGPEPFNNSFTAGNDNANNRLGLMQAAAEHPAVIGFVDANNPDQPFYSGLGSEDAPVSGSLQTLFTGRDTIHYNYLGGKHYAHSGLEIVGEMEIEPKREIVA